MTTVYPLLAEPDLDGHRGFILAEEAALKAHFSGLTVPPVPNNPTAPPVKVDVWFRFPEGERQIRYPFIIIDLLNVEPAFDLFHSDHYLPLEDPYTPTRTLYRPSFSPGLPAPPFGNTEWQLKNYLPFRLMFQVTTFARSNLHDRYLTSIFMTDLLPVRPFHIKCAADDTWRRVENLDMVPNNTIETTESGTKRIFRKAWTLSMQAEIPQSRLTEDDGMVYKVLRSLIVGVERERFDSYFETFLKDQPDPLGDFTQAEREEGGEYFHITNERPPETP